MGTSVVIRVIEQCCFNSVPDPFNGQTVYFILRPPKVIESRIKNLKTYLEPEQLLLFWFNFLWISLYVKKSQSETLIKQHSSITLTTALVPISENYVQSTVAAHLRAAALS